MVGRAINASPRNSAAAQAAGARPVLLRVEDGGNEALAGIDLTLHAGEIVGVAGLEGSGKTALARALFGDAPFTTGRVSCWDGGGAPRRPREAARRGIAYLSADRKAEGLGLRQSLHDNAALVLRSLGYALAAPRAGVRQPARIDNLFRDVELRAADVGGTVGQLSGGNQQKVIVARWLATAARVWIIVEPTRGIDIGAKATIHALLRRFVEAGGAVLMVSSDLIEIISASDRILVMGGGRILAELPAGATEEAIMAHAVHGPGQTAEMLA